MNTKNKTLALIAAAITFGSVAMPAFADASEKKPPATRKVKVSYTKVVDPTKTVFGPQVCDASGRCSILVAGPGAVTGSLTGTEVSTISGIAAGADVYSTSITSFTGTVEGCGTGAYISRATVDVIGGVSPPVEWEIIPGTGTGDLVGITGRGTTTGSSDFITYVSEGTIRCARR